MLACLGLLYALVLFSNSGASRRDAPLLLQRHLVCRCWRGKLLHAAVHTQALDTSRRDARGFLYEFQFRSLYFSAILSTFMLRKLFLLYSEQQATLRCPRASRRDALRDSSAGSKSITIAASNIGRRASSVTSLRASRRDARHAAPHTPALELSIF